MLEIRESQIEDILATQLDETRRILSLQGSISLVNRQKLLPSGRKLDLLFLSSNSLLLLELKAVRSEIAFCEQVIEYRDELIVLQERGELPALSLKSYLICPDFLESHRRFCQNNDIIPIQFSPYELLKNYYLKVRAISRLINLKPSNHGLWNLNLLNRILYFIKDGCSTMDLMDSANLSESTVDSYMRLSDELGLTRTRPIIALTELGIAYVKNRDKNMPMDFISEEQTELLRKHITSNPFSSPAIFGIYSAVETIFALSKNFYPVPIKEAIIYFKYLTGKHNEWAAKAANDAFKMYTNYSIDLGLLAKLGKYYYITPSGIRFILLLELNKSILFASSI